MNKILEFVKNNSANIIGIISGILGLWLGRKIASIAERQVTKKKLDELTFLLKKMIIKYGIKELSYAADEDPVLYALENIQYIKKQISGQGDIKLEVEDEKNITKLTEKLEHVYGKIVYNRIYESCKTSSTLDKNRILEKAEKIGLVKNDIFFKIKKHFLILPRDIVVKVLTSDMIDLVKKNKKVIDCCNDNMLPIDEKEEQLSYDQKIKELKKIDARLWQKGIIKFPPNTRFACDKYMSDKNRIKFSLIFKASKRLVPAVALCTGFAARKAAEILTNRGGISR